LNFTEDLNASIAEIKKEDPRVHSILNDSYVDIGGVLKDLSLNEKQEP